MCRSDLFGPLGRWATTAATSLLAAGVALALSCGDSPTETPAVQNELVFTRADQSIISFASGASLYVWCGPWEEGLILAPSLHVVLYGPAPEDHAWRLEAVLADVRLGQPLTFPNEFIWDHPKGVQLFVHDHPNEATTNLGNAAGSITFEQLRCGSDGFVQFSVDATLASEYSDGTPIRMKGRFRAPIGQPPPG